MGKNRDLGPHYIPELDPGSEQNRKNWHNRLFLGALVVLLIATSVAAVAAFAGISFAIWPVYTVIVIAGLVVGLYLIGLIGA